MDLVREKKSCKPITRMQCSNLRISSKKNILWLEGISKSRRFSSSWEGPLPHCFLEATRKRKDPSGIGAWHTGHSIAASSSPLLLFLLLLWLLPLPLLLLLPEVPFALWLWAPAANSAALALTCRWFASLRFHCAQQPLHATWPQRATSGWRGPPSQSQSLLLVRTTMSRNASSSSLASIKVPSG